MSISDKLTAVAENIPAVYAAGAAAGRTAAWGRPISPAVRRLSLIHI